MRFAQHQQKVLLPHKVTAMNSLEIGVGLALWTKRIQNTDTEVSYYEDSLEV